MQSIPRLKKQITESFVLSVLIYSVKKSFPISLRLADSGLPLKMMLSFHWLLHLLVLISFLVKHVATEVIKLRFIE